MNGTIPDFFPDAGSLFEICFAAIKKYNSKLIIIVSTSHAGGSIPLSIINAFCASKNIDFLAPQLYSGNAVTSNEYNDGRNINSFSNWNVTGTAKILPILYPVNFTDAGALYADAKIKFGTSTWPIKVTLAGYLNFCQNSSQSSKTKRKTKSKKHNKRRYLNNLTKVRA